MSTMESQNALIYLQEAYLCGACSLPIGAPRFYNGGGSRGGWPG